MKGDGVITLKEVAVGYNQRAVLSGINLTLTEGQLTCFMGPNGAGKSTLIKTICRFLPELSGRILLAGKDLSSWQRNELARYLSVVLTDRLNAGQLTGRELVAAGRYPYTGWRGRLDRRDWHKVDEAMEQTGTTRLAHVNFHEMSDGQRQKIMITRALCQETPLIVLDEPTAHLDLNNRVAIVSLLRDLAQQAGRAVLMATHELDLALQMADELWLAEPGKSILHGIPEDLVLNGLIDRVFQFKGYDLKTGSVYPRRTGRKIGLSGEGFLFLWTRNALERNGYEIVEGAAEEIRILADNVNSPWEFRRENFSTVSDLLHAVDTWFSAQVNSDN